MTLARRVAAVESSLTTTQLVLRWLDEAHAHGSLTAYVDSLLDAEPEDFPLNRLCREARRGALAAVRSRIPEQIDLVVRNALRETVFRFLLVLRINVSAHERLEKEELLHALSAAHLALLANESDVATREDAHRRRVALTRELLLGRADELEAASEARALAEERYLDGCRSLFPNLVEAWVEQLRATRELTAMAIRLAELDEVDQAPPEDESAASGRVAVLLADLVEPAKATALEKLGQGERGLRIATGWLRTKLDATRADAEADFTMDARTL